jgi:hypothetical protein
VHIYENAGNDEAAISDDALIINDKSNANLNDAEVNKSNVITHAIESVLPIDDPPSDVIHDDELFIKTVQIDKNAGNDDCIDDKVDDIKMINWKSVNKWSTCWYCSNISKSTILCEAIESVFVNHHMHTKPFANGNSVCIFLRL